MPFWKPLKRASAGVVVGGAGGLPAGPEGDGDRDQDDRDEQDGGEGLGAHRRLTLLASYGAPRAGAAIGSTSRFM